MMIETRPRASNPKTRYVKDWFAFSGPPDSNTCVGAFVEGISVGRVGIGLGVLDCGVGKINFAGSIILGPRGVDWASCRRDAEICVAPG